MSSCLNMICNVPRKGWGGAARHTFPEVKALYGDQMHSVFSGGIAYEYPGADQKYEDADWH